MGSIDFMLSSLGKTFKSDPSQRIRERQKSTMTVNAIPGSESVGVSCNVMSQPYTTQSSPIAGLTDLQVFDLGSDRNTGQEWEESKTGITYWVPPGLQTPGAGNLDVSASASTSRQEFAESFKTTTKISGKYAAFSGQLDVSYSGSESSSSENDFAYVTQHGLMWTVGLNQNGARLSSHFEAAIADLPDTFDSKNPTAFFDLFEKWGTHYVAEARVGGMLYYYACLSKTYSESRQNLKVSVEAEYKGLVASAKGESDSEWGKVNQVWSSARKSHIVAVGPGFQTFPVESFLSPDRGTWLGTGGITKWQEAVEKDPRTVGASFAPLYDAIADPAKSKAMSNAMDAWSTYNVTVKTDGFHTSERYPPAPAQPALLVNGSQVSFPQIPEPSALMFAVLDRSTLVTRHAQFYGPPPERFWDVSFLDDLRADAKRYATGEFVVVLCTFGPWAFHMYPGHGDKNFYGTLESWGAGGGLDKWTSGSPSGQLQSPPSGYTQQWAYILVGANDLGVGQGVEEWIDYQYWNPRPESAPALGSVAYLAPEVVEGRILYTPKAY